MRGQAMVPSRPAARRSSPARRPSLRYTTVQKIWGVLFVLPVLLLFVGFRLYPMLRAIEISFQKYDLLSTPRWVGLDNYSFLLSNQRVLNSFKVTGVFIVGQTVPLVVGALILALMLYSLPRARHIFELTFYFPV